MDQWRPGLFVFRLDTRSLDNRSTQTFPTELKGALPPELPGRAYEFVVPTGSLLPPPPDTTRKT